ncbi:MAG: tRNA pseudouridine(38-40) synthase TruA [Actinobacteria bacterium]|nr:tRNA pseudouridine(38-40) synthase TruA [Actinomycetota bacterium]
MSDCIALLVSYDGSDFHGFARQPGIPTIQGTIESALHTIFGTAVGTTGAGRTDAGVHALGQVVSFDTPVSSAPDLMRLTRSLNALCGPGIVIRGARRCAKGFSARFDAHTREYRYAICTGPVPPLFSSGYAWWVKKELDLGVMQEAALALLGEHDFSAFCVRDSAIGINTHRALEVVEITEECFREEREVTIRVVGDAFLHSMVRILVGSLVETGLGRRDVDWLHKVLASRDRAAAGPTAPPHGLTLWRVEYPSSCWLEDSL